MEADPYPELLKMHEYFKASYPAVFARMELSVHNKASLLLKWHGTDTNLKPALFMGHMDVVPVEESTSDQWVHAPFSGEIEEGFVWGRGTLDCKHVVCGLLEAAESLINDGFEPKRGIFLAFGHDEETGGRQGAASIGAALREQGIELWMIVDEGGKVDKPGMFTGKPSEAVVSIGEKGFASFKLEVDMPGGHSSRPPRQNAVETLLKAANRVNSYRFRASLGGPIGELLSFAGSEAGFWKRLMIANLWITKPFVIGMLATNPATDCIIRTTAVVTIINAGMKDNVIPAHAEAVVNTRPAFGENPESVMKELIAAINDDRVKVTPIGSQVGPSKVAPLDNDQFRMLHRLIASHFDNPVLVPGVLTGGTDTKHYTDLTDSIYRFVPVELTHELSAGVHGINERIPTVELGRMVAFYRDLIRQSSS